MVRPEPDLFTSSSYSNVWGRVEELGDRGWYSSERQMKLSNLPNSFACRWNGCRSSTGASSGCIWPSETVGIAGFVMYSHVWGTFEEFEDGARYLSEAIGFKNCWHQLWRTGHRRSQMSFICDCLWLVRHNWCQFCLFDRIFGRNFAFPHKKMHSIPANCARSQCLSQFVTDKPSLIRPQNCNNPTFQTLSWEHR